MLLTGWHWVHGCRCPLISGSYVIASKVITLKSSVLYLVILNSACLVKRSKIHGEHHCAMPTSNSHNVVGTIVWHIHHKDSVAIVAVDIANMLRCKLDRHFPPISMRLLTEEIDWRRVPHRERGRKKEASYISRSKASKGEICMNRMMPPVHYIWRILGRAQTQFPLDPFGCL